VVSLEGGMEMVIPSVDFSEAKEGTQLIIVSTDGGDFFADVVSK